MAVSIVRLGSPRARGGGLRIGTVRFPPRGVRKSELAAKNWYDVWFPVLAPSAELLKKAREASTPMAWKAFIRRYRTEMSAPEAAHALELLAKLSHQTSFSVGCYCASEDGCHRSVLRALLVERGAEVVTSPDRSRR